MPKLFEQFCQYSLIYFSGIYWWFKNPRVVSSRVNKVRNHLTALKEDAFVAVHIEGYNKVPMLGKVRSLDTSTFKLEYWRGTWRTEWKPWKLSNGDIWTDTLPKSCILLVDFVLDGNNKLQHLNL